MMSGPLLVALDQVYIAEIAMGFAGYILIVLLWNEIGRALRGIF